MKTVYILKGLPASGKTTWAKEQMKKNPGAYKRINKDDLREMFDGSHWSGGNEKFVLKIRDMAILQALTDGKHVIVDDTNLNPKHEERIRLLVDKYRKNTKDKVQVMIKWINATVEACIIRDLHRTKSVGEKVIRDMHRKYIAKEKEIVKYRRQNKSLHRAIICDIDGTLALMNGRSPYEWDKVHKDKVNSPVAKLLDYKRFRIILVSGRDESCRVKTEDWLYSNKIPFHALYMRPEGSMEKDAIIKKRIFNKHIRGKYYVEFVLDDRNQTVDLWRKELRLPCFQVNYGDF